MNTTNFLLEFKLNFSEIRKLNKMYFKYLFRERFIYISIFFPLIVISFDFASINEDTDLSAWLIRSLALIIFFVAIEYSFINTISKISFQLTKKLLKFERFHSKYKITFTSEEIYVRSPLGELTHKWSKIEKAILTKNFLFLYVKERNNYIISISRKDYNFRKIEELLIFIEKNAIPIVKV
ncbi:YcxB family protein [Flavobacterium sp. GN10]|uniref:YcxB family protein n=2 Tax=Flavobacterium tagetis TaxID=2801336 RepID=A0ABS1KGE2_9FLAO|nr:YcxB family protein [Flavobacterium tagetis]